MSKHTPGPWEATIADLYGDGTDMTRWSVCTAGDPQYFIASVENGAPGDTLDTEAANARLIAAAPDQNKALHRANQAIGAMLDKMSDHIDSLGIANEEWQEWCSAMDESSDAIAKAER